MDRPARRVAPGRRGSLLDPWRAPGHSETRPRPVEKVCTCPSGEGFWTRKGGAKPGEALESGQTEGGLGKVDHVW